MPIGENEIGHLSVVTRLLLLCYTQPNVFPLLCRNQAFKNMSQTCFSSKTASRSSTAGPAPQKIQQIRLLMSQKHKFPECRPLQKWMTKSGPRRKISLAAPSMLLLAINYKQKKLFVGAGF